MRSWHVWWICLLLAAPRLGAQQAPMPEAPVQVSLPAAADTTLFGEIPDQNLGHSDTMITGGSASSAINRAVLRFDLAGVVPTNAAILDASLSVNVVTANVMAGPVRLSLHRLLKPWGEGVKTGGRGMTATDGEATWTARFHPDALWTHAGAAAPEDFIQETSASVPVTALGPIDFAGSTNLMIDIQLWVEHADRNFGWIIVNENEATPTSSRRLATRENPTGSPRLNLTYKILAPEPIITILKSPGPSIRLQLGLRHDRSHAVQYKDSVSDPQWRQLETLAAEPLFRDYSFHDNFDANPHRFYRLLLVDP